MRDPDQLIAAVLDADDATAWRELVAIVQGALAETPPSDRSQEIFALVVARLKANEHAALAGFRRGRAEFPNTSPHDAFRRWLRVLAHHAAVDAQRSDPHCARTRQPAGRTLVRLIEVSREGDVDPMAPRALSPSARADVQRAIAEILSPDFPEIQRRALALWLRGYNAAEIAAELALADPGQATRLLHAARERLRRSFAEPPDAIAKGVRR